MDNNEEKVIKEEVKEEVVDTPKKKSTKKASEEVKEETKEEVVDTSKEKKGKKENVPETPKKVMPTEAVAKALNVRVTPRKVRLVIDLVRGKNVSEALGILHNVNKSSSAPVIKVITSAAANATNNFGMDKDSLYIKEIYANDGMKIKRYLPRAKGSSSGLVKRCSNITCVVKAR